MTVLFVSEKVSLTIVSPVCILSLIIIDQFWCELSEIFQTLTF